MDLFSIHEQPHRWWEQSCQSLHSGASPRFLPGYCMVGDKKVWGPVPTVLQKKTGLLPKHCPILCSYPTLFFREAELQRGAPSKETSGVSRGQVEAPQESKGNHAVGVATAPSTTSDL